jgi:hypothetical protein
MIDIIEALSEAGEYVSKFCRDCPAIRRIPATPETPAEEDCPADFEPFYSSECCVRREQIAGIVARIRQVEVEMAWAVM